MEGLTRNQRQNTDCSVGWWSSNVGARSLNPRASCPSEAKCLSRRCGQPIRPQVQTNCERATSN